MKKFTEWAKNGISAHVKAINSVPQNAIQVINTYKHGEAWVFDDPNVGLVKEPFVAGADTLIQHIADTWLGGKDKVTIIFADIAFPNYDIIIDKVDKNVMGESGTTYFCAALNMELWLCPALLKYFKTSPNTIWAQFK